MKANIILWVLGSILLIPLSFVLLRPEGGSIASFFLSLVFYDMVGKVFEHETSQVSKSIKTGLIGLTAFALSTMGIIGLFLPLCHWLAVQESVKIRFLNDEIYYSLAFCYNGEVDVATIIFGTFVAYLLLPIFYLLFELFRLPQTLLKR